MHYTPSGGTHWSPSVWDSHTLKTSTYQAGIYPGTSVRIISEWCLESRLVGFHILAYFFTHELD